MMIVLVSPGTSSFTFLQMIVSRKYAAEDLRMVPFGDRHICFSRTHLSPAVVLGDGSHLTPTPCFLDRVGSIDGDLVVGLVAVLLPRS